MSGLFGGSPKIVQPAPPKPAPPVPTAGVEASEQAKKKRPRGFRETFLTGDLVPETTKRRSLG